MDYYLTSDNSYILLTNDKRAYTLRRNNGKNIVSTRPNLTDEERRTLGGWPRPLPAKILPQYRATAEGTGLRIEYTATILPLDDGRTGICFEYDASWLPDGDGPRNSETRIVKEGTPKKILPEIISRKLEAAAEGEYEPFNLPENYRFYKR